MLAIFHLLGAYLAKCSSRDAGFEAENLFLRHQLNIAFGDDRHVSGCGAVIALMWMTRLVAEPTRFGPGR